MEEIIINSREELKAWLQDKPVDWARAIAHRTAMRVLPMVAMVWETDAPLEQKVGLTLAVFRANLISRAAATWPARDMKPFLRAAASAADASASAARAAAAAYAADAAAAAANANANANAVSAAASAASSASASAVAYAADAAAVWKIIGQDAISLASPPEAKATQQAQALIGEPFWQRAAPGWAVRAFDDLINIDPDPEWTATPPARDRWEDWTDWYAAVTGIDGSPPRNYFSPELELKIATQDNKWWDRGAAAVNADIARWVEEERRAKPSIADIVIELLTERGQPVQLQEIFDAASDAGLRVKEKSIRDSLGRLVSAGRIERVGVGLYRAKRDDPPAVPEQAPGVAYAVGSSGRIEPAATGFPSRTDAEEIEAMREPLQEALQSLIGATGGSNAYAVFGSIAKNYMAALGSEVTRSSIDRMYGYGVTLEAAAFRVQKQIDSNDYPEMLVPVGVALDSVVALHGPMIMSTTRGKELVRRGRDYRASGADTAAYRSSVAPVVEGVAKSPRLANPQVADELREFNDAAGAGPVPERTAEVARTATANFLSLSAKIVIGVGAIAGALALNVAGNLATGALPTADPYVLFPMLRDASTAFFLTYQHELRTLAIVAGHEFAWLTNFLNWLKTQNK